MTRAGYSAVKVEVFFDQASLDSEGYFVIGSSLIEGTDLIAGEVATDITEWCYAVSTSRGRSRELDAIQTGVASVRLRNYDARFLPDEFYAATAEQLVDELGDPIVDEFGDPVTVDTNPPYVGQIFPGKRVVISMAANSEPIFAGKIDEWNYAYQVDGSVDASFEAIDAMGALAAMSFDDWTTTVGDTPGERFTAVLDRSEVDWGPNRQLGTGVTTLQSDSVTWGSNVLNYCSLIAATDRGFFYASRKNTLTFKGRDELALAATQFADAAADILADDGTGIDFAAIEIASSSELLFNRVGVDREGGTLQTVSSTASQEAYGVRSLQITGLLMETDDQADSLARNLLDQYSEPQARVASITVILDTLNPGSSDDVKVPLHDLGDMVKVRWTPVGSTTQVEQLSLVEGKYHDITVDGLHTVRYALSPAENLTGFIIEDTLFGVIGTSKIAF